MSASVLVHMLILGSDQAITTCRTLNQSRQEAHPFRFIHLVVIGRAGLSLVPYLLPQFIRYDRIMDSVNLDRILGFPFDTLQICPAVVVQLSVIDRIIQDIDDEVIGKWLFFTLADPRIPVII